MADVIGPAALVIAATVAASGQSGPGFAGNVDPLYGALPTVEYACGTAGTPTCPTPPWQDNNIGESNAFQIIVQSTQRATGTTPPPPPPPPTETFNSIR
jgi:hypothetical protein